MSDNKTYQCLRCDFSGTLDQCATHAVDGDCTPAAQSASPAAPRSSHRMTGTALDFEGEIAYLNELDAKKKAEPPQPVMATDQPIRVITVEYANGPGFQISGLEAQPRMKEAVDILCGSKPDPPDGAPVRPPHFSPTGISGPLLATALLQWGEAWRDYAIERQATQPSGVCDICHGKGHWISKEGAEIPCDFCKMPPRPPIDEILHGNRVDHTMIVPWEPWDADQGRAPSRSSCDCPYHNSVEAVNHQHGCPERMELLCIRKRDRDDLCTYILFLERQLAIPLGVAEQPPAAMPEAVRELCEASLGVDMWIRAGALITGPDTKDVIQRAVDHWRKAIDKAALAQPQPDSRDAVWNEAIEVAIVALGRVPAKNRAGETVFEDARRRIRALKRPQAAKEVGDGS